MANTTRVRLLVRGRVQGVWYRASTRGEARRLGLRGWVRNLADGRVEAVAEGDDRSVTSLIAWCRRGPDGARVEAVDVTREEPTGEHHSFDVRY